MRKDWPAPGDEGMDNTHTWDAPTGAAPSSASSPMYRSAKEKNRKGLQDALRANLELWR